jgi:hypothetical protein
MKTVKERLDAIAKRDPTGGLKLLDCKHPMGDMCIVVLPDGRWLLMSTWDSTCWNCKKSGGQTFAAFIERCPRCEHKTGDKDLPLRNYIVGDRIVRDEHLLRLGILHDAEGRAGAPVESPA